MPLQDFDATKVQPQQPSGTGSHPCGMHEYQITNTFLKPSGDEKYLMLNVEFTSPVGRHVQRFIVDAKDMTPDAVKTIEIANKQISCICHTVNIHRITYPKHPDGLPIMDQSARELRGGRGRMDIGYQGGHEPTAEKPQGGYVEIKKYYDVNGNEPGKQGSAPQVQQPAQQPPQTQQQAPMTQQPNGNWGGGQAAANPNPAPQGNGGGWQPQGQAGTAQSPPWGAGK